MHAPADVSSSAASPVSAAIARWEKPVVLLLILINVGLLLSRLSSADALGSANDRSRWCTVWSLAARGTYTIDEVILFPGWDTIDKVRHEGNFYSTKPPLYPTMLAGLYWSIHRVTGWSLITETNLVAQVILLLVNLVPFWIALYLFWKMLCTFQFPPPVRVAVLAMLAFAVPVLPYLTVLNNHSIAVVTLIYSLYCATKIQEAKRAGEDPGSRQLAIWYMGAGFWAAFTCCNELPAALFGIGIFAALCLVDLRRTLIWFVPAALVPLIGFFITNYAATGGWKPIYMYYGTEKYEYVHRGIPSYWSDPKGVDKARDSVPEYIFHCLVGHHGIFSLTPLFLLFLPGMLRGIGCQIRWQKIWQAMSIALTVAILLFYWKRTENYNYGGVSVALRWTVWLVPFWLLSIAEFLRTAWDGRRVGLLLAVLAIPSMFSAWAPWNTPWQQPWLFTLMSQQGWIDYSDPPPQLETPIGGWVTTLPNSTEVDPDYWVEFYTGTAVNIRVADLGPSDVDGQPGRRMLIEDREEEEVIRSRELTVSIEGVRTGADPAEYLLAWDDTQDEATREDQVRLLRGMPKPQKFSRSNDRFLFLPLREDAFPCVRAAAKVWIPIGQAEERNYLQHRVDLWASTEIPFGMAQLQLSRSERASNLMFARETWRVVKVGKLIPKVDD